MKKIILVAIMFLLCAGVVSASSLNGDYKGNPIVKLKSNGSLIDSGEVPAMIYDDKTMVPIAALRNLGAEVNWDARSYSVDVKLPSTSNSDMIKKYIRLADFYNYMITNVKFIRAFVTITDNYYSGWTNNLNTKLSDDAIYNEYKLTSAKFTELNEQGNKLYPLINLPELSTTSEIIKQIYALGEFVDGSYKGIYGWKYSKIDQGSDEVGQGYMNDYQQASQKLLDNSKKIIDQLQTEYQKQINNALVQ